MRTWDVALTGEQRDFIGDRPCREFLAIIEAELTLLLPVVVGLRGEGQSDLLEWAAEVRQVCGDGPCPQKHSSAAHWWKAQLSLINANTDNRCNPHDTSRHSWHLGARSSNFRQFEVKMLMNQPSSCAWNLLYLLCWTCLNSLSWEKSCGPLDMFLFLQKQLQQWFRYNNTGGNVRLTRTATITEDKEKSNTCRKNLSLHFSHRCHCIHIVCCFSPEAVPVNTFVFSQGSNLSLLLLNRPNLLSFLC